jgi:hypothetical protein
MMEGSGTGSVLVTKRIRMRIREAQKQTDPDPQHWPGRIILLRVGNTASGGTAGQEAGGFEARHRQDRQPGLEC